MNGEFREITTISSGKGRIRTCRNNYGMKSE